MVVAMIRIRLVARNKKIKNDSSNKLDEGHRVHHHTRKDTVANAS